MKNDSLRDGAMNSLPYGEGMNSYRAAGELEGLTRLVDAFYARMSERPDARVIREMHPDDLAESRRKLTYFLSGWLGGPRLYAEHYGSIRLPLFHRDWPIGEAEKMAWLNCMADAIAEQPYAADFKEYLLTALHVPAERIRAVSSAQHGTR